MDLHELRVAARLIDGLAKRALFAEKQMVASEGQCAEWQRIAGALKAERNALRSTTIETATGSLLDAFGSLANEPRHGATDDAYRDRIVTKIHTIKLERDGLRAECDDLRRVFALVHGSLGIQQGEHIGNAIEALKKERDNLWQRDGIEQKRRIDAEAQLSDTLADLGALLGVDGGMRSITAITTAIEKLKERNVELSAERERMKAELAVVRDERDTLRKERDALRADVSALRTLCDQWKQRETELLAEIERLKKPARHSRKVQIGDRVRFARKPTESEYSPWHNEWGCVGDVRTVRAVNAESVDVEGIIYEWPICCIEVVSDEATHDTPDGKQAAESAVKREPKPGDTVRLVRIPTPGPDFDGFIDFPWNTDWGVVGDVATVVATLAPPNLPVVAVRVSSGIVVWWPLSCIEIVRTGEDEVTT